MKSMSLGSVGLNEWAIRLLDVIKSVRKNIHITNKRNVAYLFVMNITIMAFMTMLHVAFLRFSFIDTCSLSILCQVIGSFYSLQLQKLCTTYTYKLDTDITKLTQIIDNGNSISFEDKQKSAEVMNAILKDATHYVRVNLFIVLSYILMIVVCFASILIIISSL